MRRKMVPGQALQAGGGTMRSGLVHGPLYLGPDVLSTPVILGVRGAGAPHQAQMQFQAQDPVQEALKSIQKLEDPSIDVREKAVSDLRKGIGDEQGSNAYSTAKDLYKKANPTPDPEVEGRLQTVDQDLGIRESLRNTTKGLNDPDPGKSLQSSKDLADQTLDTSRSPGQQKAFEDELSKQAGKAAGNAKSELDAAKEALPAARASRDSEGPLEEGRFADGADLGNPGLMDRVQKALKDTEENPDTPQYMKDLLKETRKALEGAQKDPKKLDDAADLLNRTIRLMRSHKFKPRDTETFDARNKRLKKAAEDHLKKVQQHNTGMAPPPMTPTLGAFARLQVVPPLQPMPVATVATRPPSGGLLSAALGFAPATVATMTPTLGGAGVTDSTQVASSFLE